MELVTEFLYSELLKSFEGSVVNFEFFPHAHNDSWMMSEEGQ